MRPQTSLVPAVHLVAYLACLACAVVASRPAQVHAQPTPAASSSTAAAPASTSEQAAKLEKAPAKSVSAPTVPGDTTTSRTFFEIGPSVALVVPRVGSDAGGISYDPAVAGGVTLRASLFRWLRVGGRFRESTHDVDLPANPLGTTAASASMSGLRFTTLHLVLQPTVDLVSWLHAHGTIGLGWTHIQSTSLHLDPPNGPSLRARSGVFAEAPFGLALTADILWHWATLSLDVWYAPAFSASGDLFNHDIYVDRNGANATVGGMPKPTGSMTTALTLSLAL